MPSPTTPNVQNENFTLQTQPLFSPGDNATEKPKKTKPAWDTFVLPKVKVKRSSDTGGAFAIPLKILKAICYLATFSVVLASSCLANVALLLMTSQVPTNRTMDLCLPEANKRFMVSKPPLETTGWLCALWICLALPEVLIFIESAWICAFNNFKEKKSQAKMNRDKLSSFIIIFVSETLQACGISLLVFSVLSRMNAIRGLMLTYTLGVIPAFLLPLSRRRTGWGMWIKLAMDILCALCLVLGIVLWTAKTQDSTNTFHKYVEIPLAVVLTSFGWWENYVNPSTKLPVLSMLANARKVLNKNKARHRFQLLISPWKSLIFFAAFCIYLEVGLGQAGDLLGNLPNSFKLMDVSIIQKWETSDSAIEGVRGKDLYSSGYLPIYMALIHLGAAWLCYFSCVFACKVKIHPFAFSLPISLSVPGSVLVLSGLCFYRMDSECYMDSLFPSYVFWTCPEGDFTYSFLNKDFGWVWILLVAAQAWVTSHIWKQLQWTGASQEGFFTDSFYLAPTLCQSLLFSKRKQYEKAAREYKPDEAFDTTKSMSSTLGEGRKARIFGCATMWHETKEEMSTIIKSIMYLDRDLEERKRKNTKDFGSKIYDFELHIFFDDAFRKLKKETTEVDTPSGKKVVEINAPTKYITNNWVKQLVEVIKKSAKSVYPDVNPDMTPTKVVTPYGGRLVWTLPGGLSITAHMKDSEIVRHKKRWSQVMYLYYLLGYRLLEMNQGEDDETLAFLEQNTFILALDGDIDFKPEAISSLLDLMIHDYDLGASCGRIHPIGSGPIVWYQMFEYAIGHWLQKATEHVLGCVLCSPGCFSLFRASALMLCTKQYASVAEEPLHRLQYDQGEDRWLCTLILKQGYRIEYNAASDSYTNCPDNFSEFYTQRKRWGPSTMANIFDLILDFKNTVKKNNYISRPYIVYQAVMMLGSLVGPGTIFLMVVGALIAAFQISSWVAFASNAVPIILFSICCFVLKSQYQLYFAMFLSALYALLMLAVFVGTCIQLKDEGIASPSGIFMLIMAASFIIAGLLHPQEIFCLVPGLLYFLLVPSMYLLLTVYSLINLYDISWGTREDPDKKAEEAAAKAAQQQLQEVKKKKNILTDMTEWLGLGGKAEAISKLSCCSFCTTEKKGSPEEVSLLEKNYETMENISQRITSFENSTQVIVNALSRHSPGIETTAFQKPAAPVNPNCTCGASRPQESAAATSTPSKPKAKAPEEKDKAHWLKEEFVAKGKVETIEKREEEFWHKMIKKYLTPLIKNAEQEKKGDDELKQLRNKVVFVFLMLNSFFILVVFLLQVNKDKLFVEWPFNYKTNVTFIPKTEAIVIKKDKLQMDPVGMAFAVVFGILLILQFFGMLIHRFSTFTHIMADTTLRCSGDGSDEQDAAESSESEDETDDSPAKASDRPRGSMLSQRRVSSAMLNSINNIKPKFSTMDEYNNYRKSERQRRASQVSMKEPNMLNRSDSKRSLNRMVLSKRLGDSGARNRSASVKSNLSNNNLTMTIQEEDENYGQL